MQLCCREENAVMVHSMSNMMHNAGGMQQQRKKILDLRGSKPVQASKMIYNIYI
jgi:hypothetical protein